MIFLAERAKTANRVVGYRLPHGDSEENTYFPG